MRASILDYLLRGSGEGFVERMDYDEGRGVGGGGLLSEEDV